MQRPGCASYFLICVENGFVEKRKCLVFFVANRKKKQQCKHVHEGVVTSFGIQMAFCPNATQKIRAL